MLTINAVGNLGKDAIVNKVGDKTVINFSICHTDKNKDGTEKSTWVECAYWSDSKVSDYLKKGTKVAVFGYGELRTWESNGKNGASISVRVVGLDLCGQPPAQQQQPTPGYGQPAPAPAPAYGQQPAAPAPAAPAAAQPVWNGTAWTYPTSAQVAAAHAPAPVAAAAPAPVWNGTAWVYPQPAAAAGDLPF